MNNGTAARLNQINQRFYSDFGGSFSSTRHQAQPGVRKICARITPTASVLDIGCGNGTFAEALARSEFYGQFTGIDFSAVLLSDAKKRDLPFPTNFINLDLFDGELTELKLERFDVVTCFAALHHIPGRIARERILNFAHARLRESGLFIISNWQFLNSPKLKARVLSWESAGYTETDVDAGDYLLDWKSDGIGLRYAHHFTQLELNELAQATGFIVQETFLSDGKSGDLGLYNLWRKR